MKLYAGSPEKGSATTPVVPLPSLPPGVPQALPPSPLPPCPGTPNCVRESRLFEADPATLERRARQALEAMGAATIEAQGGPQRLHAVFRVFFFKDDVDLAVAPHGAGAVLHIRSASRVGQNDLGVNRRRVDRFFRELAHQR